MVGCFCGREKKRWTSRRLRNHPRLRHGRAPRESRLAGTQDNGTILIQPDFEARVLDGDGFHAFFDPEVEGPSLPAYYGLLYRSDDGGRTMTSIANYFQAAGPNEVGAWQTPFQLHPAVPGRIVAAKKSLHFSDDGGNTWTSWEGWARFVAAMASASIQTHTWWPNGACTGETVNRHSISSRACLTRR